MSNSDNSLYSGSLVIKLIFNLVVSLSVYVCVWVCWGGWMWWSNNKLESNSDALLNPACSFTFHTRTNKNVFLPSEQSNYNDWEGTRGMTFLMQRWVGLHLFVRHLSVISLWTVKGQFKMHKSLSHKTHYCTHEDRVCVTLTCSVSMCCVGLTSWLWIICRDWKICSLTEKVRPPGLNDGNSLAIQICMALNRWIDSVTCVIEQLQVKKSSCDLWYCMCQEDAWWPSTSVISVGSSVMLCCLFYCWSSII